jgi:hypothetical protein
MGNISKSMLYLPAGPEKVIHVEQGAIRHNAEEQDPTRLEPAITIVMGDWRYRAFAVNVMSAVNFEYDARKPPRSEVQARLVAVTRAGIELHRWVCDVGPHQDRVETHPAVVDSGGWDANGSYIDR